MTRDSANTAGGVIQASFASNSICLVPMELGDVKTIAHLGRHPEVFEHIPQIPQPFNANGWISKAIENPENYIRHLVLAGPSRIPIGYVQIGRRDNCDLELGYWLGRDYWGYGIGSAAAATAMMLFTSVGGQPRIFAATTPGNTRSRRMLRKLGFRQTSVSEPPEGMIDHVWEWQR